MVKNDVLDLQEWSFARITDLKVQNDEKHYELIQLRPFQHQFVRQQVVLEDIKISTTCHLWEMMQSGDKNEVLRSAFGDNYSTIIGKDFDSYCKAIVAAMASAEHAHAAASNEDTDPADDEYSDTYTSASTGEDGQDEQNELSDNHTGFQESIFQIMEFTIVVYRAQYLENSPKQLSFGLPVLSKDEQAQHVPSCFSLDIVSKSLLRKHGLLPVGTGEMACAYKVRSMLIGPAKRFNNIPTRDGVTAWLQSAKRLGQDHKELPEIEVYVYRKEMENEALKLLY